VRLSEFSEGLVMEDGGLRVTALRVDHPPVTECYALRFEHGGRSIVFSADTAHFPPLADFARGADILVHEAMLSEGVDRLVARTGNGARLKEHLLASHTSAADAGGIAREAGVGHLVLHHLIPADDPEISEDDWVAAVRKNWQGRLTVGRDRLVVQIGHDPAKWEPVFGKDHGQTKE
jgi:ribonuclease BN (tRNA processing enzyme)